MNTISLNGQSLNLSRFNDVKTLHAEIAPTLNAITVHLPLDNDCTTIDMLDQRIYQHVTVGTKYYIDNRMLAAKRAHKIVANDKAFAKAIVKVAFMEQHLNKSKPSKTFTQHVFGHDKKKNLESRRLDMRYVDRFDGFKGCPETKNKGTTDEYTVIRHGGTTKGQTAYGNTRRAEFRMENIDFLRVLAYGPSLINQQLICPAKHHQMESHELISNLAKPQSQSCFELHHAKFVDGKSQTKRDKDPSSFINKTSYVNFDADTINEFLGIFALSGSYHSELHKYVKHDDMQSWLYRYNLGSVTDIPHHWKSKGKYAKTIAWLVEHCDNYAEEDALSWEEFNLENCFTNAERDHIIDSCTEEELEHIEFDIEELDRDLD